MYYKLGIDLSTTNIGICLMKNNNELVKFSVLKLFTWSEKNMFDNLGLIKVELHKFLQEIENKIQELYVGVELSNFNNPLLTNRFSIYYGAILEMFRNLILDYGIATYVKCFNSNQWQRKISNGKQHSREIYKELAKSFAISHQLADNLEQDIYDAYCITYFLEQLESTEQIKERVSKSKISKKKNISKISQLQQKIMTRYAHIKLLDKQANAKKIARIEQEIKDIEQEIKKLKNGN